MRVLVTGASGKLAPYVIRELRGEHELILASRKPPSEEFSDLPWIEGDLTAYEDCRRAVEGIEAIQHLGAQSWPTDHPGERKSAEKSGIPFDATFKSNLLGLYYLMQAAIEAGVRIVTMAGSNCALGHGYRISATPFPIERLPIDESHPCHPEDSYSFTKRAGEDLLAIYSRAYGIRTHVTRIAGITPEAGRKAIADSAQPATAWNPWLWGWVGSEDVASAHRLLMEAADDLPVHDVFFLNADDTTALEPTRELFERFKPELTPLAERLTGHQSILNCDRLKAATGWTHRTSWRDYL